MPRNLFLGVLTKPQISNFTAHRMESARV